MNLALQGSKVARSRGKVPSLHPDPKDADFQGSRIYSRLKGSKFLSFQASKIPRPIAPGFSGFHGSRI